MELQISTKDETTIKLVGSSNRLIDSISLDLRFSQSERLLQEIDQIISKNDLKPEMLERIAVDCGPGSYTGIRVGVTTANFLGFSLNIPVVCLGKEENIIGKFHTPALPVYLKEPFITKEKSRLS